MSLNKKIFSLIAILLITLSAIGATILVGREIKYHNSNAGLSYDIVVVGAGPSGIGASIQAARNGSKVLLLEETDWVGGQMTAGGVPTIDEGERIWSSGLFDEFITKVKTSYGARPIATCYWANPSNQISRCFEPKVGKKVLEDMIKAEPNITLRLRTKVVGLTKSGSTITGIVLPNNEYVGSKIVIDATEYGDLIPMAGIDYRVGNTTNANLNPNACIQAITYTAEIKRYPNGVPQELLMNQAPPGYDKNKFIGLINDVTGYRGTSGALWDHLPVAFEYLNAYRGLPDSSGGFYYSSEYPKISRTILNSFNDLAVNARYLTDKNYRKDANCRAKLQTLQLMYYIQHDLGHRDWAIANDEGYNTPYNTQENVCPTSIIPTAFKSIEANMAVIPYVRESIRGIGTNTITGSQIKRVGTPAKSNSRFSDAIAIGAYANDLHGCNTSTSLEVGLDSLSDIPSGFVTGPFQIRMSNLIPKYVDGFIFAEKNISQSRLVNGASRLQPSMMVIGQASGALASLSAKNNIPARNVSVSDVQKRVLEARSSIFPFFDVNSTNPNYIAIQMSGIKNIFAGYSDGRFGPNDILTRAQFSIVMNTAFKIPTSSPATPTFKDVPTTYWAYKFIEGLYKSGVTAGCDNTPRFCPDDKVTNAQVAVFVVKGWQKMNPNIQISKPATPTYSDVPSTHWAYPFVEVLASRGIKWYCDETNRRFCPDDLNNGGAVTRGVMAKILNLIPGL